MNKVSIIGAGFSGLYAACYLSKRGYTVDVYEKNESAGGRSRVFTQDGFKFDMGPSWYWMPELIDDLFKELGEDRKEYFHLNRLDPSYKVFWKDTEPTNIPTSREDLFKLFDTFETDGGKKLDQFLKDAQEKYEIAVPEFLEKPGLKLNEVINFSVLKKALKMDVFKSVDKDVSKRFTSDKAKGILNFPVLFLGEMPNRIPSLYTLMNYADMGLGTWYPTGGMGELAKALQKIAEKNGAKFHFNTPITAFECENDKIVRLISNKSSIDVEQVIAGADYNFVEQNLIPEKFRRYSKSYWNKRRLAPSCLIYYIGINKRINGLEHHNLFFDEDLVAHGKEIYDHPKWPEKPLFYTCVPSKTEDDVAPDNCENIFLLIPIAPGLKDTDEMRTHYFNLTLKRLEKHTNTNISDHVIYKRDYCIKDFVSDYNSYKGNAYGLANTLKQTANLKPKITSKLSNLLFCGQLTVPGPGIPPALISGKIVAKHLVDKLN
jgi:phytoene desaturase